MIRSQHDWFMVARQSELQQSLEQARDNWHITDNIRKKQILDLISMTRQNDVRDRKEYQHWVNYEAEEIGAEPTEFSLRSTTLYVFAEFLEHHVSVDHDFRRSVEDFVRMSGADMDNGVLRLRTKDTPHPRSAQPWTFILTVPATQAGEEMASLLNTLMEIIKKSACKNLISIHPASHKDGTLVRSIVTAHSKLNGASNGDRRRNGTGINNNHYENDNWDAKGGARYQAKGSQRNGGKGQWDDNGDQGGDYDEDMSQSQRYVGDERNGKRRNVST